MAKDKESEEASQSAKGANGGLHLHFHFTGEAIEQKRAELQKLWEALRGVFGDPPLAPSGPPSPSVAVTVATPSAEPETTSGQGSSTKSAASTASGEPKKSRESKTKRASKKFKKGRQRGSSCCRDKDRLTTDDDSSDRELDDCRGNFIHKIVCNGGRMSIIAITQSEKTDVSSDTDDASYAVDSERTKRKSSRRMVVKNPPAKEDTWAIQDIGEPLQPDVVKSLGQQKKYVALWYKHGKPIYGHAWDEGRMAHCADPVQEQIQILQYTGDHNTRGFWYEWVEYKKRFYKAEGRQLVKCGDSIPIYWKDRKAKLLGFVDNETEIARFCLDNGDFIEQKVHQLNDMWILMRNTVGGPPGCECINCQ